MVIYIFIGFFFSGIYFISNGNCMGNVIFFYEIQVKVFLLNLKLYLLKRLRSVLVYFLFILVLEIL